MFVYAVEKLLDQGTTSPIGGGRQRRSGAGYWERRRGPSLQHCAAVVSDSAVVVPNTDQDANSCRVRGPSKGRQSVSFSLAAVKAVQMTRVAVANFRL